MTINREHHLARLEAAIDARRIRYEECLIALREHAADNDEAERRALECQLARAHYLEARAALEDARIQCLPLI